jgi:hypothetical protein
MTPRPIRPVVLRGGVEVEGPFGIALGCLESWGHLDGGGVPQPASSFGEADLRLANRAGARISAAEIAAVLARRRAIERALRAIAPDASLAGPAAAVPWEPLRQLFDGFAGIRGVGFAKATKALHRKRPALIPMLDSVVQAYLADDDPGADAPYGERAVALVRGYGRDLKRNGVALRAIRRELAKRGWATTEVRILDLLIWSALTPPASSG